MRNFLVCVCIFSLFFCACASAPKYLPGQDTYYVKAGGSDRNDGLSPETAFRSLFKALAAAAKGPIKTITVLGTLDAASEQSSNMERVFFIHSIGKNEVLIRGMPSAGEPAVLSAAGSGRRAVLVRGSSPIRFEHIVISGGVSSGEGGGMGIGPGSVVILGPGAVIRDNKSDNIGGGVLAAQRASLYVDGGMVTGNSAAAVGGGIAMLGNGGILVIRDGEICNNRAQGGGGIAIYQGSTCTLSSGKIYDNTADLAGGGVVVNLGGTFIMEGGIVRENKTSGSGGGLALLEGGSLVVKNGEINSNSAGEHGGGIAADANSAITVEGGFISANAAASWGGGVFTAGPFQKTGGKIYGNDVPKDQANTAVSGPAVFIFQWDGTYKTREKSAGEDLILNASADDGWVIVAEQEPL
jgi:hypothetical protein